jgi:hypothetical protein
MSTFDTHTHTHTIKVVSQKYVLVSNANEEFCPMV